MIHIQLNNVINSMKGMDINMIKMTSADAAKRIRKLSEDKEYWRKRENEDCTYIASIDEEPVIPDYDYSEVAEKIRHIDEMILIIKHAINVNNATNYIDVNGKPMTVDEILIKMAQLSKRKAVLDAMRKQAPKARINSYTSRKAAPEYEYINYDQRIVSEEYEMVDSYLVEMQLALDKYNQTFEFEVPI